MKNPSYAKVNLFLEICGKEPNGYHRLSTIFQEISLADEMVVSLAQGKDSLLRSSHRDVPTDKTNLILKSASAFQKKQKNLRGFNVFLKKNIPMGAGLGGGSSNAAVALKSFWALSHNRSLNKFPVSTFKSVAKSLGADVPFFLRGGTAEAGGIGDHLKPFDRSMGKDQWIVLIFPKVFVSTKWVYKHLRFPLTNRYSSFKLKKVLSQGGSVQEWAPFLYNRLEEVVLPRVRAVSLAKKALLQAGCLGALMSGSGSSVFGVVESYAKGRRVLQKVKSRSWDVWVVRFVNRS